MEGNQERRRFFSEMDRPGAATGSWPGVFLDARYSRFFPHEFQAAPLAYLERHGRTRKPRKPHQSLDNAFKVLELADLRAGTETVSAIAKIVNPDKVTMNDRNGSALCDPLFELKILAWLNALQLPAAAPIGHVFGGSWSVILYEKLDGHTTKDPDIQRIYADHGEQVVRRNLEAKLNQLRPRYERAGIHRKHWRAKDCVFRLDAEGNVQSAIPIDWERTQIDWQAFDRAWCATPPGSG